MKPFDHYESGIPFPAEINFTTTYVYSKGKILWSGTGKTYSEVSEMFPQGTIEQTLDVDAYEKAIEKHDGLSFNKEDEFIKDLFEEFGVTDNPKNQLCYSIAREKGHAYGFSEVYNEFSDIVVLIK